MNTGITRNFNASARGSELKWIGSSSAALLARVKMAGFHFLTKIHFRKCLSLRGKMRFRRDIFFCLSLFLLFSGCTLFKKSVSRPVKVAFDHSQVRTQLSSSAWNSKYTVLTSEQQV